MNRISYFPAVLNATIECKKLNVALGNGDIFHSSGLCVAKINSGKNIAKLSLCNKDKILHHLYAKMLAWAPLCRNYGHEVIIILSVCNVSGLAL